MTQNSSSKDTENYYELYLNPTHQKIILYSVLALVGLVGNVVTCIVIVSNKSMHTATNCYLFNLAVSDLLILFWDFPVRTSVSSNIQLVCQLRAHMATTSISVSILTIGVFSVERYLAICHPFKIKLHLSSLSRAIQAVPVIWFVAFLSSVPVSINHALVQVHNSNSTACSVIIHGISFYLVGLVTSAVFFVSMILICTMYILIGLKLRKSAKIMRSNSESANRSKQRAPKMLMVVVAAFFVCWTPVQMERILVAYKTFTPIKDGWFMGITWFYIIEVSQLLYYSSSLINPIIYNIISKKFRQAFKSTILKCCKKKCFTRHLS